MELIKRGDERTWTLARKFKETNDDKYPDELLAYLDDILSVKEARS